MEAFTQVKRIDLQMVGEGAKMMAHHVCVHCKGTDTVHRTFPDHEKPFEDKKKFCGGTARTWTCVRCKECGYKARMTGYDFLTK